jgi:nucleotide-binding universal stress UspA family protein
MKNILVPVDFSEISRNALKFAIKIAGALKSKIIIFHTNQPILIANDMGAFIYPDTAEKEYQVLKEINIKMDEMIEYVNSHHVQCEKFIHRGILKEDISNVVEDKNIDLIITGSHGARGLDSFFFGTNSVTMFEKVKCPVLIIPADAKFKGINKIMYATDFQYGDINELKKICELAEPFEAKVIITHVNTDLKKFGEEEESIDWFAEIGSEKITYPNITYKLIHNEDLFEGLEKSIANLSIDILCMSTLERSFFEKLISKSNTKKMAYHSKIPLMAIHLSAKNKLN